MKSAGAPRRAKESVVTLSVRPPLSSNLLSLLILFIAAVLRFAALGQDVRLHPDEALFATFARSAALNGDWLLPGPLDKPPLSIYATALSMALLVDGEATPGMPDINPQRGEFAARLPTLLTSMVVAALAYRLAWTLYRSRQVALLTLAMVAFSPYSVAFAATAFTDGWLLLWLAAALVAVATGRWGWAGVWFGLALWSKQQALFYAPLLLMLGWLVDVRPALRRRLMAFALPVGLALGLLLVWDVSRGQADSVWVLAAANNDPWRLLRSDEVGPRLQAWLGNTGWLLGLPLATLVLGGLGAGAVVRRLWTAHHQRNAAVDLLLLTFVLAYFGLHWLVAFNLYDRYLLLPLLPLALVAARGLDSLLGRLPTLVRRAAMVALFVLLVAGGWVAALGGAPIGGDQGEHTGIERAAVFLNSRALGAIVYDHWLGWELDYYLGEWTDKRRVYYPSTGPLAEDALRQPDPAPRYFIAPISAPHALWLEALEGAGFRVTLVYSDRFMIYELLPPWATEAL